MSGDIVFSIVVPTYNRREALRQSIASIVAAQRLWPCELIVVDDGSTDGTYEMLRELRLPLELHPLRQRNSGAAAARNRGARAATGQYLLFLDDDMTADERLLVEHERSLAAGADVVAGDIPLHPDLPRTVLTRCVARRTEQRRRRLERGRGRLTAADFRTGQLSVRATCFAGLEGFDEALATGGERAELLFRQPPGDVRLAFNRAAVSYERLIVTPAQNVQRWWQAGHSDALLSHKHGELGPKLWARHRGGTLTGRLTRATAGLPAPALRTLKTVVTRRVTAGRMDPLTEWGYARVRDVAYWDGARAGGGIVRDHLPELRILAYHAVDRVDDPVIAPWSVDPGAFERQMTALLADGFTFIGADRILEHLDTGSPLGPREVLMTFDDGYESLLRHAAPVLADLGIPAVVCVVTGQLGGHNEWDVRSGAHRLPLLNVAQLRRLSRAGWEIAAHTHTHAHLPSLRPAALHDEVTRPRSVLAGLGLPAPRLLAYPHGEHDLRVRGAARRAGYRAAFASSGGTQAGRFALPRVEVRNGMGPDRICQLLSRPPDAPPGELGRELKAMLRLALDGVPRPSGFAAVKQEVNR